MPKFVALLRGINVGKAKRIPMAELRALMGELGFTGIATLLNSGNAVFYAASGTPARHANAIAAAIASRMAFDVPVIVKSAKELAAVVSGNPLGDAITNPSHFLVVFVQDAKTLPALDFIAPLVKPPEQFAIGTHAAYLHCTTGRLDSKAGEALLSKAGQSTTTRNWATVLKLLALANESDA